MAIEQQLSRGQIRALALSQFNLPPQRLQFVLEYPKDLNGTQAAIRAGYSESTAAKQASRLLTNGKIQAALEHYMAKLRELTVISAENVIFEIARCGFYDIGKVVDADNVPLPLHDIDPDTRRAIVSVKHTVRETTFGEDGHAVTTTTEYKMANKLDAQEKLGRHLGIFERDNKQKQQPAAIHMNFGGKG